jgi:hypothetical protein
MDIKDARETLRSAACVYADRLRATRGEVNPAYAVNVYNAQQRLEAAALELATAMLTASVKALE